MYAQHVSMKNATQTEKAKAEQVKNNAGGYVFALDKWQTLERFLVLGNEGGTYYCSERKMTHDNANCVLACAAENLDKTLSTITSFRYRAPKTSPSIFALALLISNGYDIKGTLNEVCKTGTQLFEFVDSATQLRGWGSRLKRAVANWYDKAPDKIAYQVTKYQNRNKWSHRDVLRLCHAKTEDENLNQVFKYVCQHDKWAAEKYGSTADFLSAVDEAKLCDAKRAVTLINEYGLVRECLGTHLLNDVGVWEALLENMPMIAMLRNLGKMSQVGLLKPLSKGSQKVRQMLGQDSIRKSKVHPLNIITALSTYKLGRGVLGSNSWVVDQGIVAELDRAFYDAFENVEPTNKRFYLGIDCSGSMRCGSIAGSALQPVEGAAVLAMSTIKKEPLTYTRGFNHTMVDIPLNKRMSLSDTVDRILRTPWGATDCALPMIDAAQNKIEVDCFVLYTDNETFFGSKHPFVALKEYRQKMGINSKLIVVGMTATNFTIADPSDAGMLDVVGFDTNVPSLISEFV